MTDNTERTFIIISPDTHEPEVLDGECLEGAMSYLPKEALDRIRAHPDRYTVYEAHVVFTNGSVEEAVEHALENK